MRIADQRGYSSILNSQFSIHMADLRVLTLILLVVAVVLIGFFIWRSNRVTHKPPPARPAADKPAEPLRSIEMVQCAVCGLHCPKTDAVSGKSGVYCTAQHRLQAEP